MICLDASIYQFNRSLTSLSPSAVTKKEGFGVSKKKTAITVKFLKQKQKFDHAIITSAFKNNQTCKHECEVIWTDSAIFKTSELEEANSPT